MKKMLYVLFGLIISTNLFAQISYSGPADGSIATGAVVSTESFGKSNYTSEPRIKLMVNQDYKLQNDIYNFNKPTASEGSNVVGALSKSSKNIEDSLIIFQSFKGFIQENSIPPDPYLAVGPEHIVQVVNSSFMIYDKEGNILENINADSWFASTITAVSTFDPKVIYDHYSERWVQVWLHISSTEGYYLISVSDDSNPLGTWYNWALPAHVNGTTPSGNWGDYQGVGFDDKAIYLTSNNFSFAGSYDYSKIRIIDKTNLYEVTTPGEVTWKDIWNITYPGTSYDCFGIRPFRMETDESSVFYFAVQSPYSTGTNVGIYSLSDPLGTPILNGVAIATVSYSSPPNANQLGGGDPLIDGGGAYFRNEPLFKNGNLYIVHAVKNGLYSGVHYLEIGTRGGLNVIEDIVLGNTNYYHSYPAIAIDANNNKWITYSRSSENEYMGAYFSVIPNGSSLPTADQVLMPGQDNYVVTYGGSRNRWGDYNGIWTDPADANNIWISTEFVNASNSWGVWNAGIRAIPFENATINISSDQLDFGQVEVGQESEYQNIVIKNFGNEPLNISFIENTVGDIRLTFDALPIELAAYDSAIIAVQFVPNVDSVFSDNILITVLGNTYEISVSAEGYFIQEAYEHKMYTSTGRGDLGSLATLDLQTANSSVVGQTTFSAARSVTYNPITNKLWGIGGLVSQNADIIIMSSKDGQGFKKFTLNSIYDAIAFDPDGILYGVTDDEKLYSINTETGEETFIVDIPSRMASITFRPNPFELWGSLRSNTTKDMIVKIDLTTGDTTLVGRTGLNNVLWGLAFDNDDNLYAVQGTEYQESTLLNINYSNGVGTSVGLTGRKGLMGLTFARSGLVGIEISDKNNPTNFDLMQNYPNPFNPTTKISYSLLETSHVELTVFNSLGQSVATLFNGVQTSGNYSINFNAKNLASGVYFYRLKVNEKIFVKKMMLLR